MFTVNLILSCIFRLVVAGDFISLVENHWIEVREEMLQVSVKRIYFDAAGCTNIMV